MAHQAGQGITREIDWAAVRRQVAEAQEHLRRVLSADPALFEAELARRAEDFARPPDTAATPSFPALMVSGASGRYALPLTGVRRVLRLERWTRLPGAPPHILGLTLCEGVRHLLIDLDVLLGQPAAARTGGYAVPLRAERRVALRIEAADEVADIAEAAEQPGVGRYVRMLTPDGVAVLDPGSIIDSAQWGGEA